MKKVISRNLLVVLLLSTVLSFGNDSIPFNKDLKSKQSYITFKNVKQGYMLHLRDVNNEILYKEEISETGYYTKKFDFSFLPEGNYYFELVKELEIKTVPFVINKNSIVFKNDTISNFYKPHVRLKGNKVLISQLSMNKSPLKIKLFYQNEIGDFDLIHTQTLNGELIIETVLELSKNQTGLYKVVLFSEDHMFEKTLNL